MLHRVRTPTSGRPTRTDTRPSVPILPPSLPSEYSRRLSCIRTLDFKRSVLCLFSSLQTAKQAPCQPHFAPRPSTLGPPPLGFGFAFVARPTSLVTSSLSPGDIFFFGLFTSVDLTAVFPTTGKFFLKEFSTLSVEGCAPAFSRGCQTVVRFLCWKLLTVRLWGISVTLITSLLV